MTSNGFPDFFSLAPQNLAEAINPLSLWTKFSGQLGFINVNEMASPDPAAEADIVGRVASYGRQLGRISDLLQALCAHQNTAHWSPEQKAAVKAFSDLAGDIALAKLGRTAPTHDDVAHLIAGIKALQKSDPDHHEAFLEEIRKGLFSQDDAPPSARRTDSATSRVALTAPKRVSAPATAVRRRREVRTKSAGRRER
jgi:hypothetical protein